MTDDLEERLLPCPFRSGKNIGWKYRETYSLDSSYAFFGCRDCGIGTDNASMDNKMHPEDVSEWNTRAPDPRITDLEARLAAAEAGEDALAEALRITRERLMSAVHSEFDGVWSTEDFNKQEAEAVAALAACEARRKG